MKTKLKKLLGQLISLPLSETWRAGNYADPECKRQVRTFGVIFPQIMGLHALASLPSGYRTPAVTKYIHALQTELQSAAKDYTFGYWHFRAENPTNLPADLDDTAYAVAALFKSGSDIPAEYFLKATQLEVTPGGPYRSWYLNKSHAEYEKWGDIDPAVNANFAYCVALRGINLKNMPQYFLTCIRNKQYSSPYYPYDLIFCYYLARYQSLTKNENLHRALRAEIKSYPYEKLTLTEQIYYLLGLAYLGEKSAAAKITVVVKKLSAPELILPICADYKYAGETTYTGNRCASLALVVELLSVNLALTQSTVTEQVVSKPLRLLNIWQQSLGSTPHKLGSEFKRYQTALALGWDIYTALDDYLDGQAEKQVLLTLLDRQRESWGLILGLESILGKANIAKLKQGLATTDAYYLWEVNLGELTLNSAKEFLKYAKDYRHIERRLNGGLQALAIAALFWGQPQKIADYYDFFLNLLTLEQINDDLRDLQVDMRNQQLSYATALQLVNEQKQARKSPAQVFLKRTRTQVAQIAREKYALAVESLAKLDLQDTALAELLEKFFKPFAV